jgi:hypothetical protein
MASVTFEAEMGHAEVTGENAATRAVRKTRFGIDE